MNITLVGEDSCPRLILTGSMTLDFSAKLEDSVIGAMRRYRHLEVDLSGVHQIDQSGIHFLGLLQGVRGSKVDIVATSPAIEQACRRHLAPRCGASLSGTAEPVLATLLGGWRAAGAAASLN